MACVITLADAIKKFSQELGCTVQEGDEDARSDIIDKITEAIEHLLTNGGGKILREWIVPVQGRRATLPRDLELPVKWKVGCIANSGFGSFHSPYLSYSSSGILNCEGYSDWSPRMMVAPNKTPIQYGIPVCGCRVVATTKEQCDVGKRLMVNGRQNGRDIAALHNGVKTAGELITIYHEDDPDKKYSAWSFHEITSVLKDETLAYVMLTGISKTGQMYHLGYYHPDEQKPEYTQIDCYGTPIFGHSALHILGRVDPSIRYLRDEDVLPISSMEHLAFLAKRARFDQTSSFADVVTMEQRLKNSIRLFIAYQQPPVSSLSISPRSSGATLSNI